MSRFKKPRFGHKSYHSAINGISKYINENHKELIPKVKDPNQYFSWLGRFIKMFLIEEDLAFKSGKKHSVVDYNANIVQDNFKLFKEWIKKQ